MSDNRCPSCGFEKEFPDKPLCKYCYTRGAIGTMKMVIMTIFQEKDKLSAKDVVTEFNKLPFIKYPANIASIKKYLIDYTNWGMLSASKVRSNKVGRPQILHRITMKGRRRLKYYLKRWQQGGLVLLNRRHRKLKITSGDRERASSIRGRMHNPEYNSLDFIFPQRIQDPNAVSSD